MIRIAFAALVIGNLAIHALPAHAQVNRAELAYATIGMGCLPNNSDQPGNIIILVQNGTQVVPQGTMVTVTYMEPTSEIRLFGRTMVLGWMQKTTIYKTKHRMRLADPEGVGVRGYCLSATYESNQPLLAW